MPNSKFKLEIKKTYFFAPCYFLPPPTIPIGPCEAEFLFMDEIYFFLNHQRWYFCLKFLFQPNWTKNNEMRVKNQKL
jgi:hypothetical protein